MKNRKLKKDLKAARSIKKDGEVENFNFGKLNCWCEVDFGILIPGEVKFSTSFSHNKGRTLYSEKVEPEDIELIKVSHLKSTASFLADNIAGYEKEDKPYAEILRHTASLLEEIALRLLEQYACKKGIRLESKKCIH